MTRVRFSIFWRALGALCLSIVTAPSLGADIYASVDDHGKLLVSNKKHDTRFVRFDPSQRVAPKVTVRKAAWVKKSVVSPKFEAQTTQIQASNPDIPIHHRALHYTPLIASVADEVGVHADLLHAMIQVESSYNPNATSPKGAQGLMQLMPATAKRFGVKRSIDPEANVRGGALYIRDLLLRFDNDLNLALAAYNAGEGAVQKYNNTIPPYPETEAYVGKVLSLFKQRTY